MPKYTTGELAKLCEISVRTVQFYDTKKLLCPTALTEGGRRVYSEDDLKKLRLICMLKSLGISLGAIKSILESKMPNKALLLLLDEQQKQIDSEIKNRQRQLEVIEVVKENIRNKDMIAINSIKDIEKMMDDKKKLRNMRIKLVVVGIVMEILEVGTIYLWASKNIWWPFAVVMPFIILAAGVITVFYYKRTAYICPECDAKFKPKFKDFFFSPHTPKTRKLTCPACGHRGYCVEIYEKEEN